MFVVSFLGVRARGLGCVVHSLGLVIKDDDPDLAIKWLTRAAGNGYVNAIYQLGNMYDDKRIAAQDVNEVNEAADEAIRWLPRMRTHTHLRTYPHGVSAGADMFVVSFLGGLGVQVAGPVSTRRTRQVAVSPGFSYFYVALSLAVEAQSSTCVQGRDAGRG